ncbi:WXG100 family type VII secretion target [Nocardia pseudovaccinii]|uniref:WXG100 family type VII secretion target n=1 Tax=Nocardia pseudovaccinii TaxID=189540 RepID=UPI0007A4115A|nr:WXG100 family type VII secretion target [Nocardia pseudovaccinii]
MSGNEPTRIPPHGENVFHWERTEIEEAFKPLDPKNAHGAAMTYSNVATQWDQGLETFARSVQGSIAEAWEGSAADKAKDAINRYVTSAHELTPLITQMSNDMEAAADGVRNVANGIPEANHHSWTANVWPPRAHEEENTKNEATAGARNAMLTNYVNKFAEFDGRVPVLPTALDPTNPLDISGPIKSGGNEPGSSGPGGTSGGPTGGTSTGGETKDGTESEGKSPEETTSTDTNPTDTTSSSTNPSSTASTTPTTTTPSNTTATTSSTATTPSSTPIGTGSPGSAGSSTSTSPSPGRTVVGTPTTTSTNPAAAAATTSTSTGRSGMGMGGMGAGAGRGKSDEDSTHQIPDYLINAANTEELLGEIARTLPGGVIGEDPESPPPSART